MAENCHEVDGSEVLDEGGVYRNAAEGSDDLGDGGAERHLPVSCCDGGHGSGPFYRMGLVKVLRHGEARTAGQPA